MTDFARAIPLSVAVTAAAALATDRSSAQAPAAPTIVRPRTDAPPLRPNARPTPMPAPYFAGARQFLVQPGQNWGHLVPELKPGDELVFPAGFHVPQQVEGLRGTDERPIVLRSRDGIPAAVACGDFGWRFDRCSNLVIENVLFLNPGDAAVLIDGGGPAGQAPGDLPRAAVTLRHCTVQGSRGGTSQDGVRVRAATHVRLGRHLYAQGALERAKHHFREAVRLCPDKWNYRRQSNMLDPESVGQLNAGPDFWAAIDALGDTPFYPPAELGNAG